MKKGTVIALIMAACLIVTGGMLTFAGLLRADFNFSQETVNKVYTAEGSFQNIQIDTGVCDVRFFKTDGDLTVHCPKTERLEYIVLVEDGVLRISAMDMRKWYDFIGINLTETKMTVYLPEDQYDSLYIKTNTGDIDIPQDFSFDSASLQSDTGDVDFAATVAEQLSVSVSTGDVDIQHTTVGQLEVHSSTGEMELENVQVNGSVSLRSTTGKISAENVTCVNLYSQSSTGDTNLKNVLTGGSLEITTTTGDVKLENSDADFVSITTTSGDVTGNFLSPKWFVTETDTGDTDVPLSREGGECHITTDTGDIRFF